MKETTTNKTYRKQTFIKAFVISALALLLLVSITDASSFAYITNSGSKTVSVIDTTTNKVTATVPVGNNPWKVAVTPDGTKVYVTNEQDTTVSVIDTTTNKVITTITVGGYPTGVVVSPDGKKVYVECENINSFGLIVDVIDTTTNKVTATIKGSSGTYGDIISVSPDGTKVYVDNDIESLDIINTATNKISSQMNGVWNPVGSAVNEVTNKLYVANEGATDAGYGVSIFNIATNSYIGSIEEFVNNDGYRPSDIAVNPSGTKIYTTWNNGTVFVSNTATNTVIASVHVGNYPSGVAVTTDGTKVYVTNKGSNTVSVIDTATNKIIATVPVGINPEGIAIASVIKPIPPIPAFSASPTSGYIPLKVQFTDQSTNNPTSWKWDFGDGTTSTTHNPLHTYIKAGSLTVTLTATNAAGSSTVIKTAYIKPILKPPVAAFTASPLSGKKPLTVSFSDKSTNSPTSWSWVFGDGTSSTAKNPVHKYTKAGTYTVKLTVKNSAGSNSLTKSKFITVK